MKRVAIVIPWFGRDQVGGAEQQAWQVATRLARRGRSVHVLTTCCRSFFEDWGTNHLPAGVTREDGVVIHRFGVSNRDSTAFDSANGEFLAANERKKAVGVCPVSESSADCFVRENIHSPMLYRHLEREGGIYGAIIFIPYLYGPTLEGLSRVSERAFLHPCLHDETYAYLPSVASMVRAAKGLLFNSEGELCLAQRLFGPAVLAKGTIVGEGVEVPQNGSTFDPGHRGDASAADLEAAANLGRPFLLYVGKRDSTKNTDLLISAYRRFREKNPESRLNLVLAGKGDLPPGATKVTGVVDLGYVSSTLREVLLARCAALVQPSVNESFSRAMMEAWFHRRPVVVHRDCLATALPVTATGGGFLAATEEEWGSCMHEIERTPEVELSEKGERGYRYANSNARWDAVIDRYETALGLLEGDGKGRAPLSGHKRPAVHQLLPNLSFGDAISNQALFLRNHLRSLGFESEIFVRYLDERLDRLAHIYSERAIASSAALLYHHSIGSEVTEAAIAHRGPKALIYHNITPASFFESWMPGHFQILDAGRRDLCALAKSFRVSVGDSRFNAAELAGAGFSAPGVLPIAVDPSRWDVAPDPEIMKRFQDGRTNILFVGRLAPNKCQHHLVALFHEYLGLDPNARLILVGDAGTLNPYAAFVRSEVERLGVANAVVFTGKATEPVLHAAYRTAHLFVSMSEHEGFCVPLIEAMWFDIPILAFKAAAVPETLEDAGILLTEKRFPELAALAHLLVSDARLRDLVLRTQRARRTTYLPSGTGKALVELLGAIGIRVDSETGRVGASLA